MPTIPTTANYRGAERHADGARVIRREARTNG